MKPTIVFTVVIEGQAAPCGSKRSYVPTDSDGQPYRSKKTGQIIVNTVDANPKAKGWQAHVRNAAYRAWGAKKPLDVPLFVQAIFYRERPGCHYGTGRNSEVMKASADAFPTGPADVLKLMRGVEDALSDLVYRDDALIVDEVLSKRYGSPARVEIRIGTLPRTIGELNQGTLL